MPRNAQYKAFFAYIYSITTRLVTSKIFLYKMWKIRPSAINFKHNQCDCMELTRACTGTVLPSSHFYMHSSRMHTARLLTVSHSAQEDLPNPPWMQNPLGGRPSPRCIPPGGRPPWRQTPVKGKTDRCKNITLPQTLLAGGKNNSDRFPLEYHYHHHDHSNSQYSFT